MKENKIQTIFGKENTIEGFFELKLCKGKSIRWDSVKDHQKEALLKASTDGLYHKISDFPVFKGSKARYNLKKPFDCFYMRGDAYVVVCFYVPRRKKNFYYIDIVDYLEEEKRAEKKSFTEEEAEKIASFVMPIK